MIYVPKRNPIELPKRSFRRKRRFDIPPTAGQVQLWQGAPIITSGAPAIDPDCCCEPDPCPFILYAISMNSINAGLYTITLNKGTDHEYVFPGDTNTDTAEQCCGRAWVCLSDPGAGPPPIDLCTITGSWNGLLLPCCGVQIGNCCEDDVDHGDGTCGDAPLNNGQGQWPADGFDVDTLTGVNPHDCHIRAKASTSAWCGKASTGTPPLGDDAVGNCFTHVPITWIPGAGRFMNLSPPFTGPCPGCNKLTVNSAGHNIGFTITIIMVPLVKVLGTWMWDDNLLFDACNGFTSFYMLGVTVGHSSPSDESFWCFNPRCPMIT